VEATLPAALKGLRKFSGKYGHKRKTRVFSKQYSGPRYVLPIWMAAGPDFLMPTLLAFPAREGVNSADFALPASFTGLARDTGCH
jgi:hypothetical protein